MSDKPITSTPNPCGSVTSDEKIDMSAEEFELEMWRSFLEVLERQIKLLKMFDASFPRLK